MCEGVKKWTIGESIFLWKINLKNMKYVKLKNGQFNRCMIRR